MVNPGTGTSSSSIISGLVNAVDTNTNEAYADEPSLLADIDTPSASLTIESPTLTANGKAGEVVYMGSNINITGNLINSYTLSISSGNSNNSSNNTNLDGPTSITTLANNATPTNMEDDKWGYSLITTTADNTTATYKGISSTPTNIISTNTSGNGTVNLTRKLVFAAKFSKEALAGHYTTTVNLSLTATPKELVTYTITYDANGGTGGPSSQSCSTYTTCTVTISDTKPTRDNYKLLGWSESSGAATATYNVNDNILLSISKPGTTLYAVWLYAVGQPWKLIDGTEVYTGIEYMQDIDKVKDIIGTNFCDAAGSKYSISTIAGASQVPTITLKDKRTYPSGISNSYTIAKLPDGKCWMTQNLRLTSIGTILRLTQEDSQVSSGDYYLPMNNLNAFVNPSATTNDTVQAAYYSEEIDPNGTGYYTFCTATAGSCSYTSVDNGQMPYSICPKNWRLPMTYTTNDTLNELKKMALSIGVSYTGGTTPGGNPNGSTIIRNEPYNFNYTGIVMDRTLYNGNGNESEMHGAWWTSTIYRTEYNGRAVIGARWLNITNIYIGSGSDGTSFSGGNAVRCITK